MSDEQQPSVPDDSLSQAIDAAFAEAVSTIADEMPQWQDKAEAEAEGEDADHEHVCEWRPDLVALNAAEGKLETMLEIAECSTDREMGADCDHVAAGGECPHAEVSAEDVNAAQHGACCPSCLASAVIGTVWPYAVIEEASRVMEHLAILKAMAEDEENSEVAVRFLSEAIDNIANSRHRTY